MPPGRPTDWNPAGDLFGFARIAEFLATPRDATEIAEAAQQFGQEDDITVLTLTFAGVGVVHAQLSFHHSLGLFQISPEVGILIAVSGPPWVVQPLVK